MSEKNPLSLFSFKRILLPLLIGIGVAVLLILKDIKNDYKVIEINKKLKLDKISNNDFKKINEEILSEYIAPVQKHLEKLDEILESKNKQITIKGLSIFKRIKRKIKYLKNKIIKST